MPRSIHPSDLIDVKIRCLRGETFELQVPPTCTIGELRQFLIQGYHYSPDSIILSRGSIVPDKNFVSKYPYDSLQLNPTPNNASVAQLRQANSGTNVSDGSGTRFGLNPAEKDDPVQLKTPQRTEKTKSDFPYGSSRQSKGTTKNLLDGEDAENSPQRPPAFLSILRSPDKSQKTSTPNETANRERTSVREQKPQTEASGSHENSKDTGLPTPTPTNGVQNNVQKTYIAAKAKNERSEDFYQIPQNNESKQDALQNSNLFMNSLQKPNAAAKSSIAADTRIDIAQEPSRQADQIDRIHRNDLEKAVTRNPLFPKPPGKNSTPAPAPATSGKQPFNRPKGCSANCPLDEVKDLKSIRNTLRSPTAQSKNRTPNQEKNKLPDDGGMPSTTTVSEDNTSESSRPPSISNNDPLKCHGNDEKGKNTFKSAPPDAAATSHDFSRPQSSAGHPSKQEPQKEQLNSQSSSMAEKCEEGVKKLSKVLCITCRIPDMNLTCPVEVKSDASVSDLVDALKRKVSNLKIPVQVLRNGKILPESKNSKLFDKGVRESCTVFIASGKFSNPDTVMVLEVQETVDQIEDKVTRGLSTEAKKGFYEVLMRMLFSLDGLQTLDGDWRIKRKEMVKRITVLQDQLNVE